MDHFVQKLIFCLPTFPLCTVRKVHAPFAIYTTLSEKSWEIPWRAALRSRPFLSKAGVEILRRLRLFPIEFFYTEIIKWLPVPGAGDRSGPKADRLRNTVDFYFSTFLQCLTCFFTSKASKVNLFVYDEISSVSFKFNSSLLKDREKITSIS